MNIRRISLALLLFASCLFSQSLFAQASTEGKEFWVALTIGRGPKDAADGFEPFICVSSKTHKGTVTITNPATNWTKTYTIPTGTGWLKITGTATGNGATEIPYAQLYPFAPSITGQQQASGQTYNVGLKVTCDEVVSVFAALRYTNAFDASNILPITALQSEYIVQDYPPYANDSPTTSFSNFCILATEDNTQVEITPSTKTYDGKPAGQTYTITLAKAGNVYYVVSEEGSLTANTKSLSGTYIKAKNNKKIAVFNGDICTRTPNTVAARDIHYEQAMPTDYWGTEFVITRSKEKDANRFRITALEDGTQISINGTYFATINARETYEIELAVANDMQNSDLAAKNQIVTDAALITTSCPCAIYNYDTGNSYKSKNATELYSGYGDPSMAWVSPIQQKINDVTFGVMNTDKTTRHFVNIVTQTADASTIELKEIRQGQYSQNLLSSSDFVVLQGTKYSYARKALTINAANTYNLSNKKGGFIATIYGNGDDESYAYSAGSSAVKRGVSVDGETYTEDNISSTVYCIGTPIEFDAQVGSDVIDKVDWDFGDGVSIAGGSPQTTHTYDSPGWYDITANVYAHKECPYTTYPAEAVSFSFRVRRPDTTRVVVRGDCKPWDYTGKLQEIDSVQPNDCATDNFEIQTIVYGIDTRDTTDHGETIAHDSILITETGKWVTYDFAPGGKGILEDSIISTNANGCRHTHVYTYDLTILTCLDMELSNVKEPICADPEADDSELYAIPFTYKKGQIARATLLLNGKRIAAEADLTSKTISVPLNQIEPGDWNAIIEVWDSICDNTQLFPYHFVAYYPSSIFKQKFDNVLAVYTTAFNGGYTFTGYQWYKDGEPIDGATSSIYHTSDPLTAGSSYYVLLTRADGLVLPSCEQTIAESADANPQSAPKAEKVVYNQQLYIKLNGTLFDVFGNRVE